MSYYSSSKLHDEISQAIAKIDCSEPNLVIQGLNSLTKRSFDGLETNAVHLENFPQLAISLGCLLDAIDPLSSFIFADALKEAVKSLHFDDPQSRWAIRLASQGNLHLKVRR